MQYVMYRDYAATDVKNKLHTVRVTKPILSQE